MGGGETLPPPPPGQVALCSRHCNAFLSWQHLPRFTSVEGVVWRCRRNVVKERNQEKRVIKKRLGVKAVSSP